MSEESEESKDRLNVIVKPKDFIAFQGKDSEKRQNVITITNKMDVDVAYKLKGTSPDVIKIKPGYGYVKAKEKVTVAIFLFPLKDRPRPPTKERVTVLLATAPAVSVRPVNAIDFWRRGLAPKNPRRIRLPIKVEGYDGFKGRSIYKKRKSDKSLTNSKEKEGSKTKTLSAAGKNGKDGSSVEKKSP